MADERIMKTNSGVTLYAHFTQEGNLAGFSSDGKVEDIKKALKEDSVNAPFEIRNSAIILLALIEKFGVTQVS